jgi:dihydrofolate synthase/folylpolyglutamate synthase
VKFAEANRYLDRHINLEATAGRAEGLSLDRMRALMATMADPHLTWPAIHVTGTNGKGSTSSLISSLLSATGLRVGVYSSPHVSSITERITVNGDQISEAEFGAVVGDLSRFAQTMDETPSYFELLTAAAFLHFANEAVDVAVVEVGMLGRYDATNVIEAAVAVVTNIGTDHTDQVGEWRRKIAEEKAGIIKPNSTLVLGETDIELRDLFLGENPAKLYDRGVDFGIDANEVAVGGRALDLRTPFGSHEQVFLSLHGRHQGDNAALALIAAEAFFDGPLGTEIIEEAFGQVSIPGRIEIIGRTPLVIIDGGHTPEAAAALADALATDFAGTNRRIFVIGMLGPRDHLEVLEELGIGAGDLVIAVPAPSPRSLAVADLVDAARSLSADVETAPDATDAVRRAVAVSLDDDVVIVTGTFYILDQAKEALVEDLPDEEED